MMTIIHQCRKILSHAKLGVQGRNLAGVLQYRLPELEAGLRVTGHQVTGPTILAGSGRVTLSVADPVSDPAVVALKNKTI